MCQFRQIQIEMTAQKRVFVLHRLDLRRIHTLCHSQPLRGAPSAFIRQPEMAQLATWMSDVMDSVTPEGTFDAAIASRVKADVVELCNRFPVYDYAD